MRTQTIEQVKSAVQTLEGSYLNPCFEGDGDPISIETAVDYCEFEMYRQMDVDSDKNRSVRFDGKKAIREEIKKQILASEYIKIG